MGRICWAAEQRAGGSKSRTGWGTRRVGRGPNCFLCYFFIEQSFDVFHSILGKFHLVFSIQNYPTKILFRK
jgi:hypothetical protein